MKCTKNQEKLELKSSFYKTEPRLLEKYRKGSDYALKVHKVSKTDGL